ncbi:MAG TPA: MBL fold metallo-hydrolase [Vicinamibacteria bacterium]
MNQDSAENSDVNVLFLGTGNAFGSGGRNPISILVQAEDTGVLLDCGPSALRMLKQLGRSPAGIDLVFISHHHGDHFSGLPFLLLEFQRESRRRPFTVIGPPGTRPIIEQLTSLLFPGLAEKPPGFELAYREIEPGKTVRFGPLRATAFKVAHFPRGIALGYRLRFHDRTVVYSGDTEWTEELGRQSQGADLLICECSSFEEKMEYHMSYRELEAHRDEIGARRTLLLHVGDDVLRRRSEVVGFELADDGQEVSL